MDNQEKQVAKDITKIQLYLLLFVAVVAVVTLILNGTIPVPPFFHVPKT